MIMFIGSGATWVIQQTNLSYDLPVIKPVPSFSYKTQDGTVFTEKALQDKVSVLDFMFTSCTGPCPTMTNNMKHLYDYYEEVPDVQFVSVTVDPEMDTEEILKLYVLSKMYQIYGHLSGWAFTKGFIMYLEEKVQSKPLRVGMMIILRKEFMLVPVVVKICLSLLQNLIRIVVGPLLMLQMKIMFVRRKIPYTV